MKQRSFEFYKFVVNFITSYKFSVTGKKKMSEKEKMYAFCEVESDDVNKKIVHGEVLVTHKDGCVSLKNANLSNFTSAAVLKPICVVPYDEGMLLKNKLECALADYNKKHEYIKEQYSSDIAILSEYGSQEEKEFRIGLSERDIFIISVALRQHWFRMVDDNGEAKNPDSKEFVKDLKPIMDKFDMLAKNLGETIW